MTYTEGFKSNMIRKMACPNGISASALAKEVGVPQSSLSRWLRNANVVDEPGNSSNPSEPGRTMSPKRPQDKSAEEKLKIVMEAETVADDQLGAFLRRNGIHEAQLREWRGMTLFTIGDTGHISMRSAGYGWNIFFRPVGSVVVRSSHVRYSSGDRMTGMRS